MKPMTKSKIRTLKMLVVMQVFLIAACAICLIRVDPSLILIAVMLFLSSFCLGINLSQLADQEAALQKETE